MGKKNKSKKTAGEKPATKKQTPNPVEEDLVEGKSESDEIVELVDAANAEEDLFARFPGFKKCKKPNLELNLTYFKGSKVMGKDLMNWVFKLCKTNMEAAYNATEDMKWNDKIKREELNDPLSRFILISRNEPEAAGKPTVSSCVGFVHLRFEIEEGEPVVYVYEFQLDKSIHRSGVGKFVMSLLELIAWKGDMSKVMLTVQKTNPAAKAFYIKLGYAPDESDPGENDEEADYEILSKLHPSFAKAHQPVKKKAVIRDEADEDDEEADQVGDLPEHSDDELSDDDDDDEGDDDEGDEVNDQQAEIGEMIRKMMGEEGPIVQVVMLEPDGTVVQQEVDMSPKLNTPGDLLGGTPTFLGQYEECKDENAKEGEGSVVTVLVRKDTKGLPRNTHKLPAPLNEEAAYGRILLIRMDENAVPQSFTKVEFESLRVAT